LPPPPNLATQPGGFGINSFDFAAFPQEFSVNNISGRRFQKYA
jgi:hypothetical protein